MEEPDAIRKGFGGEKKRDKITSERLRKFTEEQDLILRADCIYKERTVNGN